MLVNPWETRSNGNWRGAKATKDNKKDHVFVEPSCPCVNDFREGIAKARKNRGGRAKQCYHRAIKPVNKKSWNHDYSGEEGRDRKRERGEFGWWDPKGNQIEMAAREVSEDIHH